MTPDQLLARADTSGGPDACWPWLLSTGSHGYGNAWHNGTVTVAHRVAYELLVGPIPDGLTIDHLCYTQRCINPRHLEPVTKAENNRRKNTSHAARTGRCKNGTHPLTTSGKCRECEREGSRRRNARHRASKRAA